MPTDTASLSTAAPATVHAEPVMLRAADGYPIAATRFTPAGPSHARLVVAGATAVPAGFYRRFAEHAAARGFDTMTLDYRGIGKSKPPSLKGFRMDYLDWARLDLAAAVDAMADQDGEGKPLFMVGHSYGGHAFGLLPNHAEVAGFYTFATGAGWHGWMPPLERMKVWALWNLLGPVWTRWKGYLPWSILGMGEDLPLDVYRQWKRWCRYPRYFFDDPMMAEAVRESYGRITVPIVAANATDDLWAPPASRDAFMAGYRNAAWTAVDLAPKDGPIGHMGYFRQRGKPLWNEVLDWFERIALPSPPRPPLTSPGFAQPLF